MNSCNTVISTIDCNMRENKEDVPPNSRIFVLHGKNTTKEELQNAFDKYGKVEDIWMVRDRESGELKGVTYVKFSKMSEAALAVEEMNGVALESNPRPLKVIIANSRDQGSRKDDDITRFLRLFIVVPKDNSETEDSLKKYFQNYGEVEYINILRNRDTNENKGFAYVKFNKIYHAAKALEECNPKYKAVLARPKEKRNEVSIFSKSGKDYKYSSSTSTNYAELCDGYSLDQGYTRLCAFISTKLTEDLATRLFDLIPGLAFASLTDDIISHRTQKMILEYETPESASFAVDRLNGFEYPVGEPIMVQPDLSGWKKGPTPLLNPKSIYNGRKREFFGSVIRSGGSDDYSDYTRKVANLTDALEEANSIIKAAGLSSGSVTKYCSTRLPPPQPIVKGEEGKYRLFIVCQPEAPPIQALKDVFCRFGNLVDVYLLPGKNYGYACFCNEESASKAITVMHGQELYGNRLKVMEAEPRTDAKRTRYE